MANGQPVLRGECFCRSVGYEVADAFEYSLICHCSGCRRATGSASKPFAGIKASELRIVRGAELLMRYGAEGPVSNHDAHCSRCGTLLYSQVRDGQYVHVTLGTLNVAPSLKPQAHIYAGSKAEWDEIGGNLPQFDQLPPEKP